VTRNGLRRLDLSARLLKSHERWSEGSVKSKLRDLVETKEAFGDLKSGFRLTRVGYRSAIEMIRRAKQAA